MFRGPSRLAIPLSEISSATSTEAGLVVRFGQRTATFELGRAAADKWASRITNPPSRLDKLGVKAGMTVLLVACDDAAFAADVQACGARLLRRAPAAGADIVFYGASRRETLDRLETLRASIKPDGALWVIRPKGRQEITEADVMAAGKRAGLVDVKVVSFSATSTAEKFVVPLRLRPAAPNDVAGRVPVRSRGPAPKKPPTSATPSRRR
jgi:hypothetical protein